MRLLKHVTDPRIRIWAVALMVATLILDAGVMEIRYLLPATVRDSDSNFIKNPASNGAVLVRLAEEQSKPCDVIFIGASNVEYWTTTGINVWNKYYAPRGAFDFGVAGDTTQNVLWRFDHMNLNGMHPKVAVIFIGINNFTADSHALALGVKAISNKARQVFPGIRVIMVSIIPDYLDNKRIERANKMIKKYADNKTFFYIDLYSKVLAYGPNWDGVKPDHRHFTEKGYTMWAEEMEPVLQPLIPLPPKADPKLSKN